jgi:hypothetical protein
MNEDSNLNSENQDRTDEKLTAKEQSGATERSSCVESPHIFVNAGLGRRRDPL